jgi:uncharacterized membrane protein
MNVAAPRPVDEPRGVSVGARGVMAGLAGLGACIAVYLTLVHVAQGQLPLACSSSGLVDCERVTSSPQSMVGPVPVAALGVVWFAVMLALLAAERRLASTALLVELVWTGLGLAVVLYLVYAEVFLIGALCAWCSALHALVIGLCLLAVFRWAGADPSVDVRRGLVVPSGR